MENFTQSKKNKLNKYFFLLLITLLISLRGYSQNVGINSTGAAPNAAAGLDIDFPDKGLLIPRISLTSTTSFSPLTAHVAGMVVYNTNTLNDVVPGFYYNNGLKWISGFISGNAPGDMLYWDGTQWVMVPIGLPGQYLQISAGNLPSWGTLTTVSATLTTNSASAITAVAAVSGGNISADGGSAILSRGVCWSTTHTPTIANSKTTDGAGIGTFTSSITGLTGGTVYYVRAYAMNSNIISYGNEITFNTLANLPALAATTGATLITGTTATSGGNVTSDGGAPITERGICYGTTANPTTAGSKVVDPTPGIGTFTSNITGLTGGTTYFVRAYATNIIGTTYGTQISFATTVTPPTLVTVAASSITGATAVSGASMSWNGGGYQNYQNYGVAYSTTPGSATPTFVATNTNNGAVNITVPIAPWVTNITGLSSGTTYYIRAYLNLWRISTSSWITVFGNELTFTTGTATAPVITSTTAITGLSANTANSGGTITSDGGSPITVKGVCWSTSPNPTLGASNFTSNGTGTNLFISNITGLNGSTLYYVRAYATNLIGTSYGPVDVTFTTWVQAPFTLGQNTGYGTVVSVTPQGTGFIISPDIALSGAGWGCSGTSIATSTAVGTGKANTDLILAACATRPIAASLARGYTGGGFNDWYLPSSGEWGIIAGYPNYIYSGVGGSTNSYYTSSQSSATYAAAYFSNFNQPYGSSALKTPDVNTYAYTIRAIRDFGASPAVAPSVSTAAITNLTGTGATSGGNVSSDGGSSVTARGVCWGTSANPTTADFTTSDGSGLGIFASNITGLTAGTTYHLRAYATNSIGTSYGSEISFTPVIPGTALLTTASVSSIIGTTAISGGNITSDGGSPVTARGVCWGITSGPVISGNITTNGAGTGTFASNISGLAQGTLYYVRAYATNANGTSYGNEQSFTTLALPTVSTSPITGITETYAFSGGDVTSSGGGSVTARGLCWSTNLNPTVADNLVPDSPGTGTGTFNLQITGLTTGTLYHVRAYATTSVGTAYGNDLTFTTLSLPVLTTTAITNIAGTSATSGGNITSDGGSLVTGRGVCWSTNSGPTTADFMIADVPGQGIGTFVSNITGLTNGTLYYVRAFAINSSGTSYGNELSFTPSGLAIPTITTDVITLPTSTGGTTGGNITGDGGSPVTARGVCWSVNPSPTTADSKIADVPGTGTGTFVSVITGLTAGTGYFIRAYATNAIGTAYGNEEYYVPIGLPTVATQAISYTAPATDAISGGNVTSDGGDPLVAEGVVWGLTSGPTVLSNLGKTIEDPNVLGWFYSSTITGLVQNTTYYVRAYATNGVGTAYGAEISFTPGVVGLATITTNPVLNKIGALAESGGNILTDGGDFVTVSGICWGTSIDPDLTTNIGFTTDGFGLGTYYSVMTGLSIGTTYHVRAYATNGSGTAYGSDVSFVATAATVGQVLTGGYLWGNVAWVDGTGLHGIITTTWSVMPADWGCASTTVATSTAAGTGLVNTTAIASDAALNGCVSASLWGGYAAVITTWYGPDWFLPSKGDFDNIWNNRVASGLDTFLNPASGPFWSSSESDATHAWYFDGTTWVSGLKTDLLSTWPVRGF